MTAALIIFVLCAFIIWKGIREMEARDRKKAEAEKREEHKKLQADLDRIHKRPMLRL